ncbi:HU family DNA-binding protein [bacterium]|nr:HU family DNA-binding protein [bacterium]
MNKGELIEAVAKEANISKKAGTDAVEAVLGAVEKALKKGDRVALIGFGTFSVAKRGARKGVNPKTGAKITIKAKKVVKFKAGAALAASVNK